MGILASIFAYLVAMASVVIALMMSFDVVFYPHDRASSPPQMAVAQEPSPLKPATAASAPVDTQVLVAHVAARSETIAPTSAATSIPAKQHVATKRSPALVLKGSPPQLVLRWDQQIRARSW